jgi:hypothetical protein
LVVGKGHRVLIPIELADPRPVARGRAGRARIFNERAVNYAMEAAAKRTRLDSPGSSPVARHQSA